MNIRSIRRQIADYLITLYTDTHVFLEENNRDIVMYKRNEPNEPGIRKVGIFHIEDNITKQLNVTAEEGKHYILHFFDPDMNRNLGRPFKFVTYKHSNTLRFDGFVE